MKSSILKLTFFAAAGIAILCALGVWQVHRLAWKQDLIARAESRAHGEPVSLKTALARWRDSGDVEYLRVRMQGVFLHDMERHLYTVVEGMPGWRIVTPLETSDGKIVMTDRGFVPDGLEEAETRAEGQMPGKVAVTGLARAPGKPNAFTPDNDLPRNRWFWRDLDGMAKSVLGAGQRERLVPFFVEAEAMDVPGGWPRGGVTRISFPNRHLEYAITWFGLALALLAVYAVMLRRWWKRGEFT